MSEQFSPNPVPDYEFNFEALASLFIQEGLTLQEYRFIQNLDYALEVAKTMNDASIPCINGTFAISYVMKTAAANVTISRPTVDKYLSRLVGMGVLEEFASGYFEIKKAQKAECDCAIVDQLDRAGALLKELDGLLVNIQGSREHTVFPLRYCPGCGKEI